MVESTGVYLALSDLTNEQLDEKRLCNGYRSEGIAVYLVDSSTHFHIQVSHKMLVWFRFLELKLVAQFTTSDRYFSGNWLVHWCALNR